MDHCPLGDLSDSRLVVVGITSEDLHRSVNRKVREAARDRKSGCLTPDIRLERRGSRIDVLHDLEPPNWGYRGARIAGWTGWSSRGHASWASRAGAAAGSGGTARAGVGCLTRCTLRSGRAGRAERSGRSSVGCAAVGALGTRGASRARCASNASGSGRTSRRRRARKPLWPCRSGGSCTPQIAFRPGRACASRTHRPRGALGTCRT